MYLIKKSTIFDENIKFTTICIWSKNQLFLIKISNLKSENTNFRKKKNLTKKSNLMKMSNLRKKSNLRKISNLRKMSIFNVSSTSPTSSHCLHLVSHFCWTKMKFWENQKNLLSNSNSCDLDAELETWAASRWKLLMQYSRWFTVLDKFSQSWPNCTILTKIHIPNFIILTKIHNSGLYGAGVWRLREVGGGVRPSPP